MSDDFSNKMKEKQLRDLFQAKGRIFIVVDATADDVDVPQFLKGDPALRLVLNARMAQAIYIKDGAVASTFSFSGTPHSCYIPMAHIWAAYEPDGDLEHGLIWEESVPLMIRSVVSQLEEQHEVESSEPSSEPSEASSVNQPEPENVKKVRHLHVVK